MYVYHYLYVRLNSLFGLNSLISKAISEKHQYCSFYAGTPVLTTEFVICSDSYSAGSKERIPLECDDSGSLIDLQQATVAHYVVNPPCT